MSKETDSNILVQHRGSLPHLQLRGQIISLNWRLAFTLPASLLAVLEELHDLYQLQDKDALPEEWEEFTRRYTMQMFLYDEYLGKHKHAGVNLCAQPASDIICGCLNYYSSKLYSLHAWSLMPNHLHLLIQPLQQAGGTSALIPDIVKKIKTYTTKEINRALGSSGQLWQHEYFDRYIRDNADYYRTVNYYRQNPVKAGLAKQAEDWPHSFYQPGLIE